MSNSNTSPAPPDPRDKALLEAGAKLAARVGTERKKLGPMRRVKGHPRDCGCFYCKRP